MQPEGEHNAGVPAPDLLQSLREVTEAGKSGVGAFTEASKALRTLLAADVSLARSALGRTLALLGVAVAVGSSGLLLLVAALVAWLVQSRGISLVSALFFTGVVAMLFCALSAWMGSRYFEHTRMKATRRQLARLGVGELAKRTPDAGSPAPSKDATEHMRPATDAQGIDITAP